GWAAVLAPIIGLLAMRGPVRPRFEFMEEGVIFRRSGKSPLLPWDEIAAVALVKAGGRTVLAYRLKPGVAVMKRHPGAGFLRAKGLDFDGGYFVDQMTASPQEILDLFQAHLTQGGLRRLVPARRATRCAPDGCQPARPSARPCA